jgi:hypothetical protein
MKYVLPLLALLAASALARADADSDARAAIALSLASTKNPVGVLCPCSVNGTCDCAPSRECAAKCITYGRYRWVETSNPNQTALYAGNVQQGNWWHAERVYRKLDGDRFTEAECPAPAPVQPPARPVETRSVPQTYFVPAPALRPSYGNVGGFRGTYRGGSCSGGG